MSALVQETPPFSTGVGRVDTRFYHHLKPFPLRCRAVLDDFLLAYETYGELNAEGTNAVLIFHAMTGSEHAAGINPAVPGLNGRWTEELHEGWWDGFIGPGCAIDTRKFFVVCANYLGGCYGSTGPASVRGATGRRWGADFPAIRMADIMDSQVRLLDHLRIRTLHAAVGASIGGYLCLSLATRYPRRVRTVVPIASGLETTVLQRLMNFEQIVAIELDSEFRAGRYNAQPRNGLASARRIAHKTFVSLQHLRARARDSDGSFEPPEQARLVRVLEDAGVPVTWISVHSGKGHNAFLLEPELFAPHIAQALVQQREEGMTNESERRKTERASQTGSEPGK